MSGRRTSLVLQLLSVAVWAAGYFLLTPEDRVQWSSESLWQILAFACYAAAALFVNGFHLFERRVHWLAAVYMWLVALSLHAHANMVYAVSSLLFVVSLTLLFACVQADDTRRSLYSAFAMVGLSAFLTPMHLYLLPLFIIYMFIANIFSIKNFVAALLGVFTPFWLFFGTVYVFPEAAAVLKLFKDGAGQLFVFELAEPSLLLLAASVLELMLLLPAVAIFAGSSSPAKPLLRRRLQFIMVLNFSLLLLSWVVSENFGLFYMWCLPGVAILGSYLFTARISRVMNIYFALVNILWILLAVYSVWTV